MRRTHIALLASLGLLAAGAAACGDDGGSEAPSSLVLEEARESYAPEIVHEIASASPNDLRDNAERVQAWVAQWQVCDMYIIYVYVCVPDERCAGTVLL